MGKRINLISLSLDDRRMETRIPIPLSRFHFLQPNVFICFGTLVKLTLRWRQFMGVLVQRRLQLHAPPNMYHMLFSTISGPVATAAPAINTPNPNPKSRIEKCPMKNKFGFVTDEIGIRLNRALSFRPFSLHFHSNALWHRLSAATKTVVLDNRLSIHIGSDYMRLLPLEQPRDANREDRGEKRLKLRNIVEVTVWKIGCTRMKTSSRPIWPIFPMRCDSQSEMKTELRMKCGILSAQTKKLNTNLFHLNYCRRTKCDSCFPIILLSLSLSCILKLEKLK